MALSRFYQRSKTIVHGIQALIILLAIAVALATVLQKGGSDSRLTYYLVICIASAPFLFYQTFIPTFKRTQKFANAYVHIGLDALFTLLWLAALLVEMTWVKDGSHAAKGGDSKNGLCDKFAWGSVTRCRLGQVAMGMGIAVDILSAISLALSTYGVLYYRSHGCLPGQDSKASFETLISAANRGENALPSHPSPETVEDTRQEMQETTVHTPLTGERVPTGNDAIQRRADLPHHVASHTNDPRRPHQIRRLDVPNQPRPEMDMHGSPAGSLASRARIPSDYANLYASQRRANPFSSPSIRHAPYQSYHHIAEAEGKDMHDEPISPIQPLPSVVTQQYAPVRQQHPHEDLPAYSRAQFPAADYHR